MNVPTSASFRVSDLAANRSTAFEITPDAAARAAIAEELALIGLRKLRFSGTLTPEGAKGWRLDGDLGATVVQPCVVTLAPVTSRIDEKVTRRYVAGLRDSTTSLEETEMPEDVDVEPLGDRIDVEAVLVEALALALPLYPRAEDAALETSEFADAGVTPLRDADLKPFAGLAALRDKLTDED
ncbi:DUF177 domain-containing protein [Pseudooceanicola sp.]|uniref:YceD family protein n=1 Tax=Pseudooceanicola sp. TaxID=1914328 RepID=UPI002624A18B|nr:DUF177 domain-containing protein [Pseudooceanicola sp.]MDF1854743.1 DUF177 domain-containing protein [Pseudooceanicola sp.]